MALGRQWMEERSVRSMRAHMRSRQALEFAEQEGSAAFVDVIKPVKSKLTEQRIESKVCRWAASRGWYVRKMTSPNVRGVPDRLFIKDGRVVFIEFKTARGRVTALQEREIEALRKAGVEAYAAYSIEEAHFILTNPPEKEEVPSTWLV